MRVFLYVLFLAAQASFAFSSEVVARFTPLDNNERFAYSVRQVRSLTDFRIWIPNITVYGVRNNDIENVSELFTQDGVSWGSIQLTGDLRKIFFLAVPMESYYRPFDSLLDGIYGPYLYMADGSAGEVRRLMADVNLAFRVTKDGRFIGLVKELDRRMWPRFGAFATDRVGILVYNIEAGTMARFEWRANNPVESWDIYRLGNTFRVTGNFRSIYAIVAVDVDPTAMELRLQWDMSDPDLEGPFPFYFGDDDSLLDDTLFQDGNPSIHLQR